MLFGGDEWWFNGPRVRPGDRVNSDRMLYDYVVKNTKFAGPTMFSRGDTTYINQIGEVIGKQRSTSIRYFAEEAARIAGDYGEARQDPEWSDEQMNFGFVTGDGSIPDAYFYVTAYPAPVGWADLALLEGAYWHTEGWTGAVLPYAALVASGQPLELLLDYLRKLQIHGQKLMA